MQSNRRRLRVLIVDDSPLLLSSLQRMFSAMSDTWEMIFSGDPVAALDLVRENPVDVMITDYEMPVMLGTELVKRILAVSPTTVCLMMTGSEGNAEMLRDIDNVAGVLLKPCPIAELRQAIRDAGARGSTP